MGFVADIEQDDLESKPQTAGRFVPLNEDKPSYNFTEPEQGQDETIMFEKTGETVTAPSGTASIYAQIESDHDFDAPTTTMEETAAVFEAQAGYLGYLAYVTGGLSDENAAPFISGRMNGLVNAQKNQPEYVKSMQTAMGNETGFFGKTMAAMAHPRALGRSFVTNSPAFALPLLTGFGGMKVGAKVGASTALIAGQLGPQVATPEEVVTVPVGAVVGGTVGFALGTGAGTAMVEFGAEMDQIASELGYNTGNSQDLLEFFQNKEVIEQAKIRAAKKGFTTASVDAIFTAFGGKFIRLAENSGKVTKVSAAVGDVTVQGIGEGSSEAAGQKVARGEIDMDEVILEGLTSLTGAAGTSAIGSTIGKSKEILSKKEITKTEKAETTDTAPEVAIEQEPAPKVQADDVLQKLKLDPSAVDETQKADFSNALDNLERAAPEVVEQIQAQEGKGFVAVPKKPETLSGFLKRKGGLKIDGETAKFTKKESPDLKGVANKNGTLTLDRARELAVEAGFIEDTPAGELSTSDINQLLVALDDEAGGVDTVSKDDLGAATARDAIIEFNESLDQLRTEQFGESRKIATIGQAFKKGLQTAKKDIKATQTAVINALDKSGLTAKDKAKFIKAIKNITPDNVAKQLPSIEKRVNKLLDAETRRDTMLKIKKALRAAKKSKVVAAEYSRAIIDAIGGVDLQKKSVSTKAEIDAIESFYARNPDLRPDAATQKKLDRVLKQPIEKVTTAELLGFLSAIRNVREKGAQVLGERKEAKRVQTQERLETLSSGVKPIMGKELRKAGIGERLGIIDQFKNGFANSANKARNISLALNPMDVFFDMLDGGGDKKNYDGPAHTIFKKTIDKAFTKYLDLKEKTTRDVKNLADKLKLDDRNFERIGVFAAAQQEGGKEKLEGGGLTIAEIDAVKLTKPELEFYNLMREKLDGMFPAINDTMIEVYNKDVAQVSDYFPFMTDFDAMNDLQIEDMVGQDLPSQDGKKKDVGKGFTMSRKGGNNAIRLDAMAVFLQHVDNAAYLVEMGKDIKELGFLAQSEEFGNLAGDLGQSFTVDWIDLLARKGRAPNRVAALDTLRANTGAAILGYKLSTVLIQPTALLDGAALLGGNYVARGSKSIATDKAWRKFLVDNMPEIRERVGDDPSYAEMGGTGKVAKVREAGFWALKNIDLLTASSVAAGAYMKAIESRGGTVDLNNVNADAIQEAQLILRRTQSSAFAKDLPQIITAGKLTGNASLDKMIFQFQSFVLNRWSIIKHDIAFAGMGRGRTQQALNGTMYLLLAQAAELGVRRLNKEIIAGLIDTDLEPWEDTIEKEVVRTLFGNIPIVGSAVSSAEFGSNPVPTISLIDNIAKKVHFGVVSKDADKKAKHFTGATLLGAGAFLGIPGTLQAEQITRGLMTDKDKGGF